MSEQYLVMRTAVNDEWAAEPNWAVIPLKKDLPKITRLVKAIENIELLQEIKNDLVDLTFRHQIFWLEDLDILGDGAKELAELELEETDESSWAVISSGVTENELYGKTFEHADCELISLDIWGRFCFTMMIEYSAAEVRTGDISLYELHKAMEGAND